MWTDEHRAAHGQAGTGFPSDLTDPEWKRLEPLIPPARPGGRPRGTDMRQAMNAILYLLRTGCPWRYLPRDAFPPRSTVYNIFLQYLPAIPGRGPMGGDLGRASHESARRTRPRSEPERGRARQPDGQVG